MYSWNCEHIHSHFLNIRLQQLQFWAFSVPFGRMGDLSKLVCTFLKWFKTREHFLEPMYMYEWKEFCCWAQLELNRKRVVTNCSYSKKYLSLFTEWHWLHSRCLDPNCMWILWPWSAGLSTATEPAWKFLPSDLCQFNQGMWSECCKQVTMT